MQHYFGSATLTEVDLTIQTETKVLVTGVGLADEGNDDGLNCDEEVPSQIATSKKILIGMCI